MVPESLAFTGATTPGEGILDGIIGGEGGGASLRVACAAAGCSPSKPNAKHKANSGANLITIILLIDIIAHLRGN